MIGSETRPQTPPVLGWMQAHPTRLRELLDDEARDGEALSPSGDAAIRAHLRFVAEALATTALDARRDRLRLFSDRLADGLAHAPELESAVDLVGGATAHELHLQFGAPSVHDEALDETVGRRVRVTAWQRVFLVMLEDALDAGDFRADDTLAWMADHQVRLADTIFAMDRRAKQAEIARNGPDAVANSAVANRIGQAATLHAHTRFLVDALAATLGPG